MGRALVEAGKDDAKPSPSSDPPALLAVLGVALGVALRTSSPAGLARF